MGTILPLTETNQMTAHQLKSIANPALKRSDEPRLIDTTTSARRERFIVACILDRPEEHPGPNVCTAIAYAPFWWDSPEAAHLADAIGKCWRAMRPVTEPSVAEYLGKQWQQWLGHPSFSHGNALSLEIAELEAMDLVRRYEGKRITNVILEAGHKCRVHPERARTIARDLVVKLGEYREARCDS